MNRLVFTITLFAYCVNYAQSMDPLAPSRQLGSCCRLIDVEERTNNEELALTLRDTVEICRMRGSDDEFCLVVSKESYYGLPTNEYHTFHSRDAKFTFMKSTEYTEMAVLRDGAVLWDLSFTTKTYNALRGLYFDLTEHQDQLRTIGRPFDLRKRDQPHSEFYKIATSPFLIIDDESENLNVLHVVNTGGDQKGPVLVIMKGKMTVYAPEGDKVYMHLHDFPRETYYFTCASPNQAAGLSYLLGRYNVQQVAIPRIEDSPTDSGSTLEIVTE